MGNPRFESLWNAYYSRISYYISHAFPTLRYEAGDLTQEVFARAYASLDTLDGDRPAPWLYAVARNLCVDRVRKKDATVALNEDAVFGCSEGPERDGERRRIAAAVEGLDARDRELCYLYYFEEMPVGDIGRLLDRPTGTVKYRLFRIRAMLRKRLEDLRE